jgi:hypothetical protein
VPCLTFSMAKFVKCLPVDATSISNEMEFVPLLLVRAQELVLIPELWKSEAKCPVVPLAIQG